ncbi:penicillin acylase family protein [Aliikangiella coralliicola]|uniref:Penicillin acylase family protein n=1 Tax=Aliikangiella coralliicola TaxID=2592383 RepID=A0A545UD05_9GAMM|nr:penicillin acylase family protein [Aliikangiella coralliicola]TQV87347.1 penicillin acylase family protein [Aliikangiella coralliicola]
MSLKKRPIFGELGSKPRRRFKALSIKSLVYSLFTLLLIIFGYAYFALRASLPILDGEQKIPGLADTVTIKRDATGVVDINAKNRLDLAQALGYLHGQERFFQLDLSRRNSAGELAELFGEKAVNYDKSIRIHQFRQTAQKVLSNLSKHEKAILTRYTLGVNQGLADLKESPFEYLLLRQPPRPWKAEDSLLVVYSMYLTLQSRNGYREHLQGLIYKNLPQEIAEFLLPAGTEWDAPIKGNAMLPPPLPESSKWGKVLAQPNMKKPSPPEQITTLNTKKTISRQSPVFNNAHHKKAFQNAESGTPCFINCEVYGNSQIGSNNWAVSGELSVHQSAMLAGDMHLGIRVPNTWFRAQMHYQSDGKTVNLYGLTLPGTPLLVAGSNTQVAWTFTNSYGDWSDLVELTFNDAGTHYQTSTGEKPLEIIKQIIISSDNQIHEIEIAKTIWGPVIKHHGINYAYRWVAHDLEGLNLKLLDLEKASSVNQALIIGNRAGIPAQNLLVVDNKGSLGWTIAGPIPKRQTENDSRLPTNGAENSQLWTEYLSPDEYPRVINPDNQFLWTANARVVSDNDFEKLGDGGLANGARAKQIKQNLSELTAASERDLFKIQLDDRALFLARWRKLMLQHLENVTKKSAEKANEQKLNTTELNQIKQLVANWSGHADKDDVGYWLVKRFRQNVAAKLLNPIYQTGMGSLQPVESTEPLPAYDSFTTQYEAPLWQIVNQQPLFLLPGGYSDWHDFFVAQIRRESDRINKSQKKLEDSSWGSHNTAQIQHPISRAVPLLGYFLDMPKNPLSGDEDMPRVQGKNFGASQRMVVAPGNEENGILHMPTGQSGHPLSPFYRAGHQDWVDGVPTPFTMQQPVHQLILTPK